MIKTIALGVFALLAVALGGLLAQAAQRVSRDAAQLTELRAQNARLLEQVQKTTAADADLRAEVQKSTAAVAELEEERARLAARKAAKQSLKEARNAAASAPRQPVSPTPAPAADGKKLPANPLNQSIAKMMQDPAMKSEMRAAEATHIKRMYGDLVKQWGLSPEEANNFYALLLDKRTDQMDLGMKVLESGTDAVQDDARMEDPDAKLKASLGADLYKQYQDYEKTTGARTTLSLLQQELVSSNTPILSESQGKILLQAISE